MQRSVLSLRIQPEKVLVDGRDVIDVPMACESVIKGDQKEPAIMAASIIAKHMRDRLMLCLSQRFPQYGFDRHAGYPTKIHKAMIREHGKSIHHVNPSVRKNKC